MANIWMLKLPCKDKDVPYYKNKDAFIDKCGAMCAETLHMTDTDYRKLKSSGAWPVQGDIVLVRTNFAMDDPHLVFAKSRFVSITSRKNQPSDRGVTKIVKWDLMINRVELLEDSYTDKYGTGQPPLILLYTL